MPKHVISTKELKERYSGVIVGIAVKKWWSEAYNWHKVGSKSIKLINFLHLCNREQFMSTYRYYIKQRRKDCITYLKNSQKKDVNSAMQTP